MINVSENISENGNNIKKVIKGSAFSIIITLIGLLIYSIILSYTSVSESTIPTIVIIITAISVLIGSTISTSNIKKNGIINGICVGGLYLSSLYILSSIAFCGFLFNLTSVIMIVIGIILGGIGGIIGVNMGR